MISPVNSCIPQSLWCTTNHSWVPSSLWEITSERMASSDARPPALRMTWASPSARPAYFAGSSRAHAGEDGEAAGRRERQFSLVSEVFRVIPVGGNDLIVSPAWLGHEIRPHCGCVAG